MCYPLPLGHLVEIDHRCHLACRAGLSRGKASHEESERLVSSSCMIISQCHTPLGSELPVATAVHSTIQ